MKRVDEEQRTSQETETKDWDGKNLFTVTEENTEADFEVNTDVSEVAAPADDINTVETSAADVDIEVLDSSGPDIDISDVQGKVGQIFQNTVAATTSVAVVVVATPLFDNVSAQFVELRLLENQIYYEVEVIEAVGEDQEPSNRPLRLIIENQFERIEVELEYGLNAQVLNNLRPNAQYTFTVQMDKGIVWTTLLSERVRTQSELAGVIGPAETRRLDNAREATFNIFTQAGGEEIQFYQFVLKDEGQAIITEPLVEGEQSLTILVPLANKSFQIELQAITANSELRVLDSRAFNPRAIFDSTVKTTYLYPHQILVQPTIVADPFIDVTYRLVLKQNGVVIENIRVSDDLLLQVSPSQTYDLEWVAVYTDPRTNQDRQDVLSQTQITTPPELFYIIQEMRRDDQIQVVMQFENFNTLLDSVYVDLIDASGTVTTLSPMQFITANANTGLYDWRYEGPIPAGARIEIGVILVFNPNFKIPLYQITP